VTVDFARSVRAAHSMSGFLHACSATEPPDECIMALRPALWRVGWMWLDNRDRLARLGIPVIMVLSDTWGPHPPADAAAWDAHVRKIAGDARGRGFTWDIWNEPDISQFWKGTRPQFFETYARAARALRAELGPRTRISGPSITHYDHTYIAQFLDYCVANKIRLDVLSWHELAVDADIPSITDHLRDARASFLNDPAYKSLGIQKIQINEIVGPTAQYEPGEILGYFAALERGGADGACKGCWPDSHGRDNCANATLDGILTPDTHQPRAAWWAYKVYADGLAGRVACASANAHIAAFAAREGDGAQVVLGAFAYRDAPPVTDVRVRLAGLDRLPGVKKSGKVRVTVERIPNTGEVALPSPERAGEQTVSVIGGVAEVTVPGVRLHEAYRLTLK